MSDPRSALQADLRADVLADLTVPERPILPTPVEPAPVPPVAVPVTPVVSVQWTPLRWSRPRVVRATGGAGKALRLAPVAVELTVKE
jgi:hypothetical protein